MFFQLVIKKSGKSDILSNDKRKITNKNPCQDIHQGMGVVNCYVCYGSSLYRSDDFGER